MKEIGGYIELDQYTLPMLHENAVALNCGRNCLAYLIRARNIKKIVLPYFLCDSVKKLCYTEKVSIRYYSINKNFVPLDIDLQDDEWLYLVNFYGQLSYERIKKLEKRYKRIIVDQAQAYFDMPIKGIDTLYTCRKFLGVSDGAFLYTDAVYDIELPYDESFERMHFLLGRFERTASEFYREYVSNNHLFATEPIKKMSRLTYNLLHGIDYTKVKQKRTDNFKVLSEELKVFNSLDLVNPEGAFAYPLMLSNGAYVRKKLLDYKIYIPTLWPNVLNEVLETQLEYNMAQNILPIPCDQRYNQNDMEYIVDRIKMIQRF